MRLPLYPKLAKRVCSEWERTSHFAENGSVENVCVLRGKQGAGGRGRKEAVGPRVGQVVRPLPAVLRIQLTSELMGSHCTCLTDEALLQLLRREGTGVGSRGPSQEATAVGSVRTDTGLNKN